MVARVHRKYECPGNHYAFFSPALVSAGYAILALTDTKFEQNTSSIITLTEKTFARPKVVGMALRVPFTRPGKPISLTVTIENFGNDIIKEETIYLWQKDKVSGKDVVLGSTKVTGINLWPGEVGSYNVDISCPSNWKSGEQKFSVGTAIEKTQSTSIPPVPQANTLTLDVSHSTYTDAHGMPLVLKTFRLGNGG